jgi:hypothetical protein
MAPLTDVLYDDTTLTDWGTARDAARMQSEFTRDVLALAPGGAALDWQFVSRGVVFNDIFLSRPLSPAFESIHVQVRNVGAALTLACKIVDADGAEWTANQAPLPAKGDWQVVEFPRDQWHVAGWSSDPDGKIDAPTRSFALIAYDIKPGPEYHLQVRRIEVSRPAPPVITISRMELASRLQHGQQYPVTLQFRLDRPYKAAGMALVFDQGGSPSFRAPLTVSGSPETIAAGQIVSASGKVQTPVYVTGGRYNVFVEMGDSTVLKPSAAIPQVTAEARPTGNTIAAVRPLNGAPGLFLNNQPHNPIVYTAYGPSAKVFTQFAGAGVDVFSFCATPTEAGYGLSTTAWLAPGKYDFSQLDERAMMALDNRENSYFFPRLYLHAPRWWSDLHPDDLVKMDPGDGKPVLFIDSGGKPAPSWASETWRKDTVEGLRRLITHVESSPYADRCIGYHLASGTTEEWMMWGANDSQWVYYSPANEKRFRQWFMRRYANIQALQNAWHDTAVTFDTATIPSRAQREHATMGSLRDPAREQPVIDFYLYNSDLVADTIDYFARAVKQITANKKIVGVFYGYLLQLCGEQRQQNAGHLALARVLESPNEDFVCSPTSYAFRQLGGEGTSHFMSLLSSVQRHGKLWFDENDIRTSISGGKVGEWGRPANIAGDFLQQDKELANVIVNRTGQWWFDVGGNRYDAPALMGRLAKLTEISASVLQLDRTPVDQAAMIVDEDSLVYLRVGDPLGAWLLVSQLPALLRAGAPVGTYLSEDLPHLASRRIFFFMTGFAPSEKTRAAVESLKRDGHVLVFFYAPGLYRNGQVDEAGMESLTGIRLRRSQAPMGLQVSLATRHDITAGLPGLTYGPNTTVGPVFYADDPAAEILGALPGGQSGLVARKFAGWTSIFSAAPMMPEPLIRALFKSAGVHLYIDTPDVVWATHDLLAVCVKDPGKRQIHLPRPARITDLYAGTPATEPTSSIEVDFADLSTRLFTTT